MPDPDQIPYVRQVKHLADIDSIRAVPIIGNLYGTANTVIDYAESGCHPDWNVYAETLFPALGEAVLVLFTFGLDDVLRGYFRPASGRGFGGLGRASRRPKPVTKAARAKGVLKGGIPEIGELIGKNLPGAEIVRGRNVGQGEKFLWRVDGLAQRGLWYWMIADILEDFTVNWTTALMESEECNCPMSGGVRRVGGGSLTDPDGDWQGVACGTVLDEWGGLQTAPSFVDVPLGQSAAITFTCNFHPWPPTDGTGSIRIQNITTGAVAATSFVKEGAAFEYDQPYTVAATVPHGRWQWQASGAGGIVRISDPEASVWVSGC